MIEQAKQLFAQLESMSLDERIDSINALRVALAQHSPFKDEPVDCVRWLKNTSVTANDYNPNAVAPPEMELLHVSIASDGYTQPIVSWDDPDKDGVVVIDGFHRHRVGKEYKDVAKRVHGYLPIVVINSDRSDRNDRIASTIRHNRARGKHQIDAMSEIVIELKKRNWKNSRVAKELGMDEEEVLRLCQISGLEDLFSDNDFSKAWEADDTVETWEDITDEVTEEDLSLIKIPHEGDMSRVYHTYDKWECYPAGFYESCVDGKSKEECEKEYASFLRDTKSFEIALSHVVSYWTNSCEHYLTNGAMNRVAWLGQASACYAVGLPSKFCSGYNRLSEDEREIANRTALSYLNFWLTMNGRSSVSMDIATSSGRQVETY